jgi:hypothetical protein
MAREMSSPSFSKDYSGGRSPIMRSAPADGYDANPQKRHYRRQVWATIRKHLRERSSLSNLHVAMMPSSEGTEIDIALQSGFREQHIHAIDRNPAIVAHLKRRYPKIQTYGVDLSIALGRIAKSGVMIAGANLDLCGPVGSRTFAPLVAAANAEVWDNDACVCVNVLRGREQVVGGWTQEVERRSTEDPWTGGPECAESDNVRLSWMSDALAGGVARDPNYMPFPLRREIYRSNAGSQTFMWSAWWMHHRSCVCGLCGQARQVVTEEDFDYLERHSPFRSARTIQKLGEGALRL